MHQSGAGLAYLPLLIDARKLKVVIGRIFPFAETKEAIPCLKTGHAKGKAVLTMS